VPAINVYSVNKPPRRKPSKRRAPLALPPPPVAPSGFRIAAAVLGAALSAVLAHYDRVAVGVAVDFVRQLMGLEPRSK
jgi:hypothetical protein